MILLDTSVWIDHLGKANRTVAGILETGQALMHPFVMGELALGNLRERELILSTLERMPQITVARDDEVLAFIGNNGLAGSGIGYIDAHLLASVKLTAASSLWTRDRRLRSVTEKLKLSWSET